MQQSDFLELVFGDQQGYVVTQPRAAHHGVWRKWPSAFTTDDQYFSPIVYSNEQRTKDDTAATSLVIYVDADRTDLDEFFTWTPSIRVTTSEGSHHLYWVLDAPVPMKDAAALSQRIGRAHKMEPSAGIAAKLLRLPGTLNTSSEKIQGSEAFPVTAESTGLIYSYAELSAGYPEDNKGLDHLEKADLNTPTEWPSTFDLEDLIEAQSRTFDLMEWDRDKFPDADRSAVRWELINLLLEGQGRKDDGRFTPEETTSLVWATELANKFKDEGRPIDHLWEEVKKAVANQQAKELGNEFVYDTPSEHIANFMSVTERSFLAQSNTFVDTWVEEAYKSVHAKTPVQYLRTNAVLVLSCLLGPHFGGKKAQGKFQLLNLYVFNIGDQNSGKSDAMREFLNDLRAFDAAYGTSVSIGSKATASGLTQALREKNNQAALWHTDEVSGLFKNWTQPAGPYADVREMVTELFDGWLPKHRLASKDAGNDEDVFVHFNVYLNGTPKATYAAMTRDFLNDGFTARALVVRGRAAEQTPEDVVIDEGSDDEVMINGLPEATTARIAHLHRLTRWANVMADSFVYRLPHEPNAKKRYEKFRWDVQTDASMSRDPEISYPHARRLGINTWKVATLFAAERYSNTIEMTDVLHAIELAETWWAGMLEMIDSVSASEFLTRVEDLHKWLHARDGRVLRVQVMDKSPIGKYNPKEADEVLRSMQSRGMIKSWDAKYIELVKSS